MTALLITETFFSLGLFINAVLFLPQIIKLYKTKNSNGLSFITFFGFNLIQLLTILHGYFHKDYILMLGTTLSLISCGIVSVMIVYYKKNNF